MRTLKECKDRIAELSGFYADWNEFYLRQGNSDITFKALDRAAQLYAQEALEEAAKEARVKSEFIGRSTDNRTELFLHEVDKQSILKLIDNLK